MLAELLDHGIRPRTDTPPQRVKDLLNDLYCYELRAVRARLARREFPKTDYARRVVAVRARYPLLSVPLEQWTIEAAGPAGQPSLRVREGGDATGR